MAFLSVVGLGLMSIVSCAMVMKPSLAQQVASLFRILTPREDARQLERIDQ